MTVICALAMSLFWVLQKTLNLKRLHRQKKITPLRFESELVSSDKGLSISGSKHVTTSKSESSDVNLEKGIPVRHFSLLSDRLEYFGLEVSFQEKAAGFIVKIQWFTLFLFFSLSLIGNGLFAKGVSESKTSADGDVGFLLYGFCLFCMWLRILLFVQVQQELGQFVGVLISMARDLGFFGIVWIILILAFSSAMLGAGIRSSEENQHPMQSWSGWWLLRTYLQSLGQDNIGEMTTHTSNAIFVFMWPMFNILLVNLLVAVMSSRYEKAREDSGVSYCFDLHELYESYTYKTSHHEISLIWNLIKYILSGPGQHTTVTTGPSSNLNAGVRNDTIVKSILDFKKFLNSNMAVKANKDTTNREKDLRKELDEILSSLKEKIKAPNGDNVFDPKGNILISRKNHIGTERRNDSRSIQSKSANEVLWTRLFTDVKPDVFYGKLLVLDHYEETTTPEKASWHERLCFIMEGNLCSVPYDAGAEPEVICSLSEVRIILIRGHESPPNSFSLVLEPQRTLALQTYTDEDRIQWINKLFEMAFTPLHEELMRVRAELSEAVRENEGRATEIRRMQVNTIFISEFCFCYYDTIMGLGFF